LKTLEAPPTTESILSDIFTDTLLLTFLRGGVNPVIRTRNGFRACELKYLAIRPWVEMIESNGFVECPLLEMVSSEELAHIGRIDGFPCIYLGPLVRLSSVRVIGCTGFKACRKLHSLTISEYSLLQSVTRFSPN
jgi:hypothetical protein